MSEFRVHFVAAFGADFPGQALELPLPRLRFELAVGDSLKERLATAEWRAKSVFHAVFEEGSPVWLELTFWPDDVWLSPAKQMEVLTRAGLQPIPGRDWEREIVIQDGGETRLERHSAPVPAISRGMDAVLRGVMWADYKEWRKHYFRALAFDPKAAIGFWPYDDRGLDVFAAEPSVLIPLYRHFDEWILDYDRSRIKVELGI